MVHRRLILFVATFACAQAQAAGPVKEFEKDVLREDAVREILRMVPETSIEPDLATVRELFRRPIRLDEAADPAREALARIQLLSHRYAVSADEALGLIAETIRYKVVRLGVGELKTGLALPTDEVSVDLLLQVIEEAANVRINLYPESALIVVRPK